MALTSQNGWPAGDQSVISSYPLPGGKVALRSGDVAAVLLWCANRWHTTVEPLVWPGVWGYAYRAVRGSSTTLSNHASGTAIDINAPAHPLGTAPSSTLTPAKIAAIHAIVAACGGVVRWGGDYGSPAFGGVVGSRPDPMHLEINAGPAAVAALAAKIRGGMNPAAPAPAPMPAQATPVLEDDLMASIPLPLDAARSFQAAIGAEAGGGSQVASRGWVTFGSTFGPTTFTRVAALSAGGLVLQQWENVKVANNTNLAYPLPDGTRCLTVQGVCDNAGTRPWASYWGAR